MEDYFMAGDRIVLKPRVTISILLLIALSVSGCSSNTKKRISRVSSSESTSIVIDSTYELSRTETFYCMRVNDRYYSFTVSGSSAELLSADEQYLYPDIEDGQFARVTADVEMIVSSFGYVPVTKTISTRITDLKSCEPMEFGDITKIFNLPSADGQEINKNSKLFQYTRNGKLYLIFVCDKVVSAYTEDGLLIEYELKDGEDQFKRFFEVL